VVEVAGQPVLAVGENDVRAVAPHHRRQSAHHLFEGDVGEGVWRIVGRPSGHPGVAVAEQLQVLDAEMGARGPQLGQPLFPYEGVDVAVLAGLAPARTVALLAVGTGDEHSLDTLVRIARQGATGGGDLVVGVGVHSHQPQPTHDVTAPRPGGAVSTPRLDPAPPCQLVVGRMKVRAVMVSEPTAKTAKSGRYLLGRPRLTGGPRRVAGAPILGHALPTGRVGA